MRRHRLLSQPRFTHTRFTHTRFTHAPLTSPLRNLLKGAASCALALLLARAIEVGVRAHLREGNVQIAADSLSTLWAPGVFALVGVLFLGQALLQGTVQLAVAPLRRSRRSWRAPQAPVASPAAQPATPSAPAPSAWTLATPTLPSGSPDPYREACRELGVRPGTSWTLVRSAWRRNLSRWHPDAGGDSELWHRRLAAYQLLEAWESLRR